MRRRDLTDSDREVWANFARYVRRRPARDPASHAGDPASVVPSRPPIDPPPSLAVPAPRPRPRPSPPLEVGTAPAGVDRSTWTRFRSGKLSPERTLDLHGHTVQRAHAELHDFIDRAISERLRCVEVITGRGSGEVGGALRREAPLWLNAPALRPAILAASHPHPANQGALRLLLRRVR